MCKTIAIKTMRDKRKNMQEIILTPTFFGNPTPSSDKYNSDTYKVSSSLCDIIMEERKISEKAFSRVDESIAEAKEIVNNYKNLIKECIEKKQRIRYIAEQIYDKEFNSENGKKGKEIKEIK